jgi:hypothetical protein
MLIQPGCSKLHIFADSTWVFETPHFADSTWLVALDLPGGRGAWGLAMYALAMHAISIRVHLHACSPG